MYQKQELSEKSLEFVKQIITSTCGDVNINLPDMFEMEFKKVADMIDCNFNIKQKGNTWEHNYIGLCKNKRQKEMKVIIEYNPDDKFEYFRAECCLCNGSLSFYLDLCRKILRKLFIGTTGYRKKMPENYENEMEKYIIKYTVGDFVFGKEFGEKIETEDKTWMMYKLYVMLPIKCDFIKK